MPVSIGCIEIVRASFNVAVSLGKTKKNPITKARFPRYKEIPLDKILQDIDKQRLLNVIDSEASHLSMIVRFALIIPCRKSELVNMCKEDLDLINNAIRVRNGKTKNDAGVWKPIPEPFIHYSRNLPKETDYLFYRKVKDEYKSLGDFKKAWKRCLKLAGIEDFRFHDTRHISATDLVDAGTPEAVVNTIAGWKTNMLKNYYNRNPKKALELVKYPSMGSCAPEKTENTSQSLHTTSSQSL